MHSLTSVLTRVLIVSSLPFDHVHAYLHMYNKTTKENIHSPVLIEDWYHVNIIFWLGMTLEIRSGIIGIKLLGILYIKFQTNIYISNR
jgi:hypothetical protein